MAAAVTLTPGSSTAAAADCSGRSAILSPQVTVTGGTARATFSVAAGCTGIRVSLATYRASSANGGFPQTYNDSATGVFSAGGPFTLTADVASCYFQVDLVLGDVIVNLRSTGNPAADIANGTLYGPRKVKVVTGGTQPCGGTPPPPPPPANQPISIFAQCVTVHGATYDATFGYANDNSRAVTIPAGSPANAFSPGPPDRGQPSTFQVGMHPGAVTVSGIPIGTSLTWRLTFADAVSTASASASFGISCGSSTTTTVTIPTTTTARTTTATTPTTTTATTTSGTTTSVGTTTVRSTTTVQSTTTVSNTVTTPTVASAVDVAITKKADSSSVAVGANVTWTLVVVNNGPATATGVTVVDQLPPAATFVSAGTSQGTCTTGEPVTCAVGTLAPGSSATITIVTLASEPGTEVNHATVTSVQPDTNPTNNAAEATVTASGPFTPPTVRKPKKPAPHKPKLPTKNAISKGKGKPSFTG